jgi:putative glutamine amidotransferase
MTHAYPLPLVGIPCCHRSIGQHGYHVAGDKYIRAVAEGSGAVPLLIPALGDRHDMEDLVARLDGLFITGSPSNIEPHRYGGTPSAEGTEHDRHRDATTIPLIRAALAAGLPLFGVCRGLQELNVALGGTLHQRVHELNDRMDHRANPEEPLDVQFGPAHRIYIQVDGMLARLFNKTETIVNSVHWQGIDWLADRLAVEAVAPDGQIEAVRVADVPGFALAVQWHPEWRFRDNPESIALFQAFGDAIRYHAMVKRRPEAAQ